MTDNKQTTEQAITIAAQQLLKAYETNTSCQPIRHLLNDKSLETAYAVQNINTNYWLKKGRRLVGRKIGLTSKTVQQQLGVEQPDYGMLFADMCQNDSQAIDITQIMQPKIEAEIALVLEKDLTAEHHTIADIITSTAYALPALEIVGSRIENWDITITDTIADNASSGLFVLGQHPRKLRDIDLRLCGMVMERRGEQVSVGAGIACLGNPLNAALWLANTMVKHQRPLLAGDIILTGALGPMVNVETGDILTAAINGLGSVRAHFM